MKHLIVILASALAFACSPENAKEVPAQQPVAVDPRIAKLKSEIILANFYVVDPNDPATQEPANVTFEAARLTEESRLFDGKNLRQAAGAPTVQYKSFVAAHAADPSIRKFRRESAAQILTTNTSLSLVDRVYFTNELIDGRSDNLTLITQSVRELSATAGLSDKTQLRSKTLKLLSQYEQHFADDLKQAEAQPVAEGFKAQAAKVISTAFAQQGLEKVQKAQQSLE